MRKRIKKGASLGCDGKSLRNLQTASINLKSTHAQDKTICHGLHSLLTEGIISATSRKTGRRLGGLQFLRRLIAMPLHGVFLLAVSRTHGVSLPKTLTGTPYGNPQGLSLPKERSANLYGVAHPLGGGVSFTTDNLALGDSHE